MKMKPTHHSILTIDPICKSEGAFYKTFLMQLVNLFCVTLLGCIAAFRMARIHVTIQTKKFD